ncbi:28320_t:CDS:2 [Dentiscutata erythropus]|uniref:28320_t:CDS:1 n=1 Tax=Dentiscutata erythropus TaxID=1348616 RepID=A0A9N9B0F7_9GLOM|nr:28320_t:CDS:2 [Dentiscutata erythropus]
MDSEEAQLARERDQKCQREGTESAEQCEARLARDREQKQRKVGTQKSCD